MQDIPQETLSETTKAEQSAKVDLWEFDLTAIGGERFFFCNEPNEKGEPLTRAGRQYEPYPIQVQDFEMNGKAHLPARTSLLPISLVWSRGWRRICKVSSARQW